VYLLQCSDGSFYCGVTKNIENRLTQHNEGIASKYTRSRLPVEMVVFRDNLTKREAYQLEYRIKKTPAQKKIETLNNWIF
jgi:putative endonuclease